MSVSRKILLVEGTDDRHVIMHLCGNRGLPELEIRQYGGVSKLLPNLPVQLKASDVDVLGVVLDADTDLNARWDSLKNLLAQVGYTGLPYKPISTGTIIDAPADALLPKVGIWIMPNNTTTGNLEDFLRFLVPSESKLFAHVQNSVAGIPEEERRFHKNMKSKAVIHTWLAWQEEPGKPLGTAITARYLDHEVPQVDDFVVWLRDLFFSVPDLI